MNQYLIWIVFTINLLIILWNLIQTIISLWKMDFSGHFQRVSSTCWSIIECVFYLMSDFVLFFQIFFEVFNFFTQKVVHFELFLDHTLKFINIGVDIVVNESNSLNSRNELTFLGQKLGIFFNSSHMSSENFFLLFQNVRHLFLKSKILFFVFVLHGSFHGRNIILYLCFSSSFFLFHDIINFNFLCDLFLLRNIPIWFGWIWILVVASWWKGFLNRGWSFSFFIISSDRLRDSFWLFLDLLLLFLWWNFRYHVFRRSKNPFIASIVLRPLLIGRKFFIISFPWFVFGNILRRFDFLDMIFNILSFHL